MKNASNIVGSDQQRKSRALKIAGSAVLLISFVTQNFLYDRWTAREALLEQGGFDRSLIDKSVLLNEVLYFTAQSVPGANVQDLKEFYIHEAARKLAISSTMPVVSNEFLKTQEKVDLLNSLLQRAHGVSDFSSFLSLVKTANDSYGKYSQEMSMEAIQVGSKRAKARYIYLGFYILGALLLLAAIRKE
jgi:hypothetical protein